MFSDNIPSITLPAVTVTHILGSNSVELAQGDLCLIEVYSSPEDEAKATPDDSGKTHILTLTIGNAAFSLYKSTLFGTLANDERAYIFTPEIGEPGGYVKILLPDEVKETGSYVADLQEQFEEILIKHGLLKEGVEGAGDEVGRRAQESAKVREATTGYLVENPPTKSAAASSSTTHSVTSSSASATGTLFTAAHKVTAAVGSAAATAGAWVAGHVPATHENTARPSTTSNAYDSTTGRIGAGASESKAATTNDAGQAIENDHGREARDVAGDVNGSLGNASGAVGEAALATSGTTVGVEGLNGETAMEMENLQQELRTYQGREGSGDWQDLSV